MEALDSAIFELILGCSTKIDGIERLVCGVVVVCVVAVVIELV